MSRETAATLRLRAGSPFGRRRHSGPWLRHRAATLVFETQQNISSAQAGLVGRTTLNDAANPAAPIRLRLADGADRATSVGLRGFLPVVSTFAAAGCARVPRRCAQSPSEGEQYHPTYSHQFPHGALTFWSQRLSPALAGQESPLRSHWR